MRRRRYYQLEKVEYLQKIILLFLIGFFFGGCIYYFFQMSFQNVCIQSEQKETTIVLMMKTIWQHGKYLILYFVFRATPVTKGYEKIFSLYTGIRNGFLFLFFLYENGIYGIIIYFLSLFPHGLLLLMLYVYLFLHTNKNKQERPQVVKWILVLLVFFAACIMEVKFNLPIMARVL